MQCLDFGTFHLRFLWQSNFIVFIPCFQSSWAWCSCSVTDQDRNFFLGKTWIASQIFSATFQWCFARVGRWLARLKRDKVFTLVVLLLVAERSTLSGSNQTGCSWGLEIEGSNNISMILQMCSEYINLKVWRDEHSNFDLHNLYFQSMLWKILKKVFAIYTLLTSDGRVYLSADRGNTHSQLPVLTILSLLDSSPKS